MLTLRRRRHIAVLLLFALAVVLRVALAARQGLWADEFFSLAMATGHSVEQPAAAAVPALGDFVEAHDAVPAAAYARYLERDQPPASPARVIRAVFLSDTSPPLYYLLLSAWTAVVGTGDPALHLFSVAWALAAFPLIYLLGRRLGGWWAGFGACVLFTLSPVSLYYSVEGRMYAQLWFVAVLFAWVTLRRHDHGDRPSAAAAWALAGAAGLLTHYFFAFVWAAITLWLLCWPGRTRRRVTIVAAVVTGVAILPWYLRLPESLALWRVTGHWLDGPLTPVQALSAPVTRARDFFTGRGIWGGERSVDRIGALLFALLGLATLWRWPRWLFGRRRLLLWAWVAAACMGPVLFDISRGTYTALIPRYALAGLPAALLLAGVALGRLRPAAVIVLLALIAVTWAPGVRAVFHGRVRAGEPYRRVAREIMARTHGDALVVVHSIPSGVAGIARYLDPSTPVAAWVAQLGQRRVPEDIAALTAGRSRMAFVRVHDVGTPAPELEWLIAHAGTVDSARRENATVVYLTLRVPAAPAAADAATGAGRATRR
ncbi:MAG: glycosyltransferase family 39 protein [Gemmatimonadales bacterium]